MVGAKNQSMAETIFKVQYYKVVPDQKERRQLRQGGGTEEWHGNGMLAFTTKAGAKLLAITHRFGHEAIVMKSPYAFKAADGGGSILQRFGTPPHFTGTPTGLTYHKVLLQLLVQLLLLEAAAAPDARSSPPPVRRRQHPVAVERR